MERIVESKALGKLSTIFEIDQRSASSAETLELVPQLGVLQVDVRSVGGVCVGDILLETVEKMLWDFHCNFHYHESVKSLFFFGTC